MEKTSNELTYHGVFLNIHGIGTLLTGKSGCGKSELALSLINRGHQLITDDIVILCRNNGELLGKCPELLQDFLQIKNMGIMNIRKMFGEKAVLNEARLELIINLKENTKTHSDSIFPKIQFCNILDIKVPEIIVPKNSPHTFTLVECAVLNYHLQKNGYDANDEFIKKQRKLFTIS